MLLIRKAQMRAMGEPARADYAARLRALLESTLPREAAQAGDGLERLIADGIERALDHGFTREREVGKFVAMMLALEPDFDSRRPWAREILAPGRRGRPETRLRRLLDHALRERGEGKYRNRGRTRA